jgi:ubiquinone biosynthesis protein UbiJ
MANEKDSLKKQIDEIASVIKETRNRLPAHSAKPPIMMELIDLEDQYDQLMKQLHSLEMDEN